MEGHGDGQALSQELLQNLQSAVGSSGVIGQVQTIETENGPMTVIFMEEGADAGAETTLDVNGDNIVQTSDGEQIQYQFIQDCETSTTQIYDTGQASIGDTGAVSSSVVLDTSGMTVDSMQNSNTDTYYITDTGEIVKIESSLISEAQLAQQGIAQTVDATSELPQEQTLFQIIEDPVSDQNLIQNQTVSHSTETALDTFGQPVIPNLDTSVSLALEQSGIQTDAMSLLTQDQAVMETISALSQLQQKQPVVQTTTVPKTPVQVVYSESSVPSTVMTNIVTSPEYTAVRCQPENRHLSSISSRAQPTQQRSLLTGKIEKKSVSSQVTHLQNSGGTKLGTYRNNFGASTFRVKKIGNKTILEPVSPTIKQSQPYARVPQGVKKNQPSTSQQTVKPAGFSVKAPVSQGFKQIAPRPSSVQSIGYRGNQAYTYSYVEDKKTGGHAVQRQLISSNLLNSVATQAVTKKPVVSREPAQTEVKPAVPPSATILTKQFLGKVPTDQVVLRQDKSEPASMPADAADLLSSAMQEADMQLEETGQGEDAKQQGDVATTDTLTEFLREPDPAPATVSTDQVGSQTNESSQTLSEAETTKETKVTEQKVLKVNCLKCRKQDMHFPLRLPTSKNLKLYSGKKCNKVTYCNNFWKRNGIVYYEECLICDA